MLKFNNYPPTTGKDIQLSALAQEDMEEHGDDEAHRKELGKSVGGIIMANITDRNLGSVINILDEFSLSTEGLDDWTNKLPFLQGALEGAMEEASAIQRTEA